MLRKIKQIASRNLVNIPGWRTDRKIIVIESDDWGSIRMPSKKVYDKMLNKGISVNKSPYCKYDSLASEEDLEALFEVLTNFRDSRGIHPVITANSLVANPDFDKINASNFNEYSYEPFTDTLKRYPMHAHSFLLWKEGMDKKVFFPQFHGREHLNVKFWLDLLQSKHTEFMFAFEHRCFGLSNDVIPQMKKSVQAALDAETLDEVILHQKILTDGIRLFEDIFSYKSKSFIANNFIWDSSLNETLGNLGVEFIQGMKYQKKPMYNRDKRAMNRHYLGEINKFKQYYLIRNCTFEPSQKPANFDSVGKCLGDIKNAFLWNKPAIISSHRLNFIGFIEEDNRYRNLAMLSELLYSVLKNWPEVEFMTSVELGKIIKNDTENIFGPGFTARRFLIME